MSKAIKCDRCKRCFDPYKEPGEFARIGDYILRDASQYYHNECAYLDEEIDFCPECAAAFSIFMKGERSLAVTERNRLQHILNEIYDCAKITKADVKLCEINKGSADLFDSHLNALLRTIFEYAEQGRGADDCVRNGEPTERTGEPQQEVNS